MKRIIFILVLLLGLTYTSNAQYYNTSVRWNSVTLDASENDTIATVNLYTLFGIGQFNTPKMIGFTTDTNMTATAFTFNIYDPNDEKYKPMKDTSDTVISIAVSDTSYYVMIPIDFAGIEKFQIEFNAAESYDKKIGIAVREY